MPNDYLIHSGRKGQKWGVKNGPPYPLDYSKLSAEEREHAKGEAIKTGNIREADANVYYFDNKEIQATIDRYLKKADLRKMSIKDADKGKDIIEDLIAKGNKFVRFTDTGIKVYNNIAKISNAATKGFTGTEGTLPIVGGKNDKQKKGDRNKDDDD